MYVDDLRKLLPKGFEVIGGLIVGDSDADKSAFEAVRAARRLRKHLSEGGELDDEKIVGASCDAGTGTIHFFISKSENLTKLEPVGSVVYEDKSGKYLWENGCLLHCELPIKLPFYFPATSPSGMISDFCYFVFSFWLHVFSFLNFSEFLFPDSKEKFSDAIDAVITQFKEPYVVYIAETLNKASGDVPKPVVLRGKDLGFGADASNINRLPSADQVSHTKMLSCSHFFLNSKTGSAVNSAEVSKPRVLNLISMSMSLPPGLLVLSPPLIFLLLRMQIKSTYPFCLIDLKNLRPLVPLLRNIFQVITSNINNFITLNLYACAVLIS